MQHCAASPDNSSWNASRRRARGRVSHGKPREHIILFCVTTDASSSNLKCWPFYLMHLQGAFDVALCRRAACNKRAVSTIKARASTRTTQAIHFPFYKTHERLFYFLRPHTAACSTAHKVRLHLQTAAAGAAHTNLSRSQFFTRPSAACTMSFLPALQPLSDCKAWDEIRAK